MLEVIHVQEMLRLEAEVDLPDHSLMRTAAFGLYVEILDIARENFGSTQGLCVLGLIGPGNNGSDALWAMSLLSHHGIKVIAIDTTGKRNKVFADDIFEASAGCWTDFNEVSPRVDMIIDGIAGLRNHHPSSSKVMSVISDYPEALIVSVDMPSCFDNDRAVPIDENAVIHADYTITFGYLKPCHVFDPARSLCGEIRVVELPIASPQIIVAALLELNDVVPLLKSLDTKSHKYSHGVIGIIAGSNAYPGAGELALLGSQWGGSGYIQYLGPKNSASLPHVVRVETLSDLHEKTDTVVFGPGVEVTEKSKSILQTLLKSSMTLVLDADAITLLSQYPEVVGLLSERKAHTLLTPHHGEATRLAVSLGVNTERSVHIWISEMAVQLKSCIAYKSAHGFIALPDGTFVVSNTTSSALATAGTGDVLSGLMGSLIARNAPTSQHELATCAMGAVIIHSIAAQLALVEGMNTTALDIALQIRHAISLLEEHDE